MAKQSAEYMPFDGKENASGSASADKSAEAEKTIQSAEGGFAAEKHIRFYDKSPGKAAFIAAALCLLAAFICITIGSKSSFLYAFHDANDVNWFLTMGRGIVNGKVPYKDLFEQKGILTYMMFALNYAICGNHLYVIYVIEVLCMTAFAWICFKICRMHTSYVPSLFVAVLSVLLATCSFAFVSGGGEVEEYILPLLAYGLYVFVRYAKQGVLPVHSAAICGACSSVIFWMKFTAISFYAVFAVCVFVDCCIKKQAKRGLLYALAFVMAFAAVSVPWLAYLGANSALDDMWRVYIYDNIFSYGGRIFSRLIGLVINILRSAPLYVFTIFAAVSYWRGKVALRYKIYYTAILCIMFVLQCISAGDIRYYHLVMAIYLPLGLMSTAYCVLSVLAAVAALLRGSKTESYSNRFTDCRSAMRGWCEKTVAAAAAKTRAGVNVGTVAIVAVLFAALTIVFGNCTLDLLHPLDYYPQFKAAQIMREEGGGNLLTYKTFDRGFYTAYDETPEFYYFAQNNFDRADFPEMYEGQESYVINGLADFVVTETGHWLEEKDTLLSRYEFVADLSYYHVECNTDVWHEELCLLKLAA